MPDIIPIHRALISVSDKSGLEPFARALAARGVDTRTLQAFMGHRSIANTVVYTAVAE